MTMAGKRAVALSTATPVNLRVARTCYDHLAGEVAVSLYDFLLREAWIAPDGTALTPVGEAQFARLGIMTKSSSRRKACCGCLDWSERRFHLGGGRRGAAAARSAERLVYHYPGIPRSDDYVSRMASATSAFSAGEKYPISERLRVF